MQKAHHVMDRFVWYGSIKLNNGTALKCFKAKISLLRDSFSSTLIVTILAFN